MTPQVAPHRGALYRLYFLRQDVDGQGSYKRVQTDGFQVEVVISETAAKVQRDAEMWVDPLWGKANIGISVQGKSEETDIYHSKKAME